MQSIEYCNGLVNCCRDAVDSLDNMLYPFNVPVCVNLRMTVAQIMSYKSVVHP